MNHDHPMKARLDRVLEWRKITIEQATLEALQAWVCDQELQQARRPQVWTDADVDRVAELLRFGQVGFESDGAAVQLIHDHPFFGPIFIDGDPNLFVQRAQEIP